jgi:hypothetical protein
MAVSVDLEVPGGGVDEVDSVVVDGDTATGLVVSAPDAGPVVEDVGGEDVAEVVTVSGVVDGGGQNVQYELGRPPSPVSGGGP